MSPKKSYKGRPMEGLIAKWYAKITTGDARGFKRIARAVVDQVGPGSKILEVAPGPGYLAAEIAKLGAEVSGLDISRSFVRIASENARREGVSIDFRLGDAANMPFSDESFDFVICTAAFKNFTDPVGAINEIHRVLKPGGRASIQDLSKDAPQEAIDTEVRGMKLSWLNTILTIWTFRLMLLKRAYTDDALKRMVSESSFRKGEIIHEGIGFDLRLAK